MNKAMGKAAAPANKMAKGISKDRAKKIDMPKMSPPKPGKAKPSAAAFGYKKGGIVKKKGK